MFRVSCCSLNQWALDFDGNTARIQRSILEAKRQGAIVRSGPELEICGYGCADHFLELDTFTHCWQSLLTLLTDRSLWGILVDCGMPIMHRGVKYNCRVWFIDGRLLLCRPKMIMAMDGNYRESRWFTPWTRQGQWEPFQIPSDILRLLSPDHPRTIPFGDCLLQFNSKSSTDEDSSSVQQPMDSITIGSEICEELFAARPVNITMALAGVDIICNGSASHHELRKLQNRLDLICGAMRRLGGIYLYSNQMGCDGDRLYYDGCPCIVVNGDVVAQGKQFGLGSDVEVISANVDLDRVRQYRAVRSSHAVQAAAAQDTIEYNRIQVESLVVASSDALAVSSSRSPRIHDPQIEIAMGPACWLWDYLRRSGMSGFFLPLSGGIDSCSVALIVYSMCRMIVQSCQQKDSTALADIRKIVKDNEYLPNDPTELTGRLLHTCYMRSKNSSNETRMLANRLADSIGSYHINCDINSVTDALISVFHFITGRVPLFKSQGGSPRENLALQNIQARSRMVLAYLFAQLLPWHRGNDGSLLVLGSANVDESLRGYFTKYDCSSADLNPIGGISKSDLKLFVEYAMQEFNLPLLADFLRATPSAELEPPAGDGSTIQSDEQDMGMTYRELGVFGRLRKIEYCGPVSMLKRLITSPEQYSWMGKPLEMAEKVKRFFFYYGINRHKMTTLTPAYHAESYSPDDNRFDLRPFLYNSKWDLQFRSIDDFVKKYSGRQ